MEENNITIEGLARMIERGFEEGAKKDQLESFESWTKQRFNSVDRELKVINKKLTGVVYRYEFEELEDRVKELEGLLAVNLN